MRFGAILAISVGLAMDATAVSAARGMAVPEVRPRHAAGGETVTGGAAEEGGATAGTVPSTTRAFSSV